MRYEDIRFPNGVGRAAVARILRAGRAIEFQPQGVSEGRDLLIYRALI